MSHEIYENRFVAYRQPAWHRLGTVFQDPLTASEAWSQLGPYNVVKVPLYAINQLPDGHEGDQLTVPVLNKFAVTGVFPDLGKQFHYGVVDTRYELITPQNLVSLWDTVTRAKVETMGCLQKGKRFFMTTELAGFDVNGDEHRNYLSILSPHAPGQSLIGLISPVRVVCQNTMQMALAAAQQKCLVPHRKGAFTAIATWLKDQYESARDRSNALQQALEILAQANVKTEDRVEDYLEHVFPTAKDEEAADKVIDARYQVTELFNGKAIGSESRAFAGTYYGLYNAVVEHIDYGTKARQTVFYGESARVKERAFEYAAVMAAR